MKCIVCSTLFLQVELLEILEEVDFRYGSNRSYKELLHFFLVNFSLVTAKLT